jgi:hypothetical protein
MSILDGLELKFPLIVSNQCLMEELAIRGWEVTNPFIGLSGLNITEDNLCNLLLIFPPFHSNLSGLVEAPLFIISKHMSRWQDFLDNILEGNISHTFLML